VEFVASRSSTGVSTSYTFSNVPLGVYEASRIIVLSVHWYRNGTASTLSSASVGGDTTTSRVATSSLADTGFVQVALLTAAPTGVSGTISLTFGSTLTAGGCVIGVWALYDATSAVPVDTASSDINGTFVLSAQPADFIVAAAAGAYSGSATSWVNATENFDTVNSQFLASAAQRETTASGDPGIDFNMNVSSTTVGVAAVWR